MSGITLIIPTYNRSMHLRETLESIAQVNLPCGIDVELLVINNNCTDNTSDVVAEGIASIPFPVRHVVETQQGLCYGRNRGIAEARFEHLGYLDDDVRVSPDWISGYFEAVNEHGADAVVGPVFPLFLQPKPDYLQGAVLDSICSPYSRRGDKILELPEQSGHELPGCNFGVTKAAAMEVQGFDNTLDRIGDGLIAGGDFEFGYRLIRAGKRTIYHPHCWIRHVMISEKLTKPYLRRRALGMGMTTRAMAHPEPLGRRRRMIFLKAAAKARCTSLLLSIVGRGVEAFECELKALTDWGYLRGHPEDHRASASGAAHFPQPNADSSRQAATGAK